MRSTIGFCNRQTNKHITKHYLLNIIIIIIYFSFTGALLAAIASFAYCVPVSYEMYSQYEPNDILTYSYHDDKVYSDEKDLSGYNMEDDYQYTTDIISEEEHVSNGLHPDHTEASSGTDSKTAEQSTDTMSSTFNASSNELYFETFTRNSTRFRSETTVVHQSATTALHSDMPNLMTPTSEIFGVNKTIMNAKFSSKSVQDDAKKALKLFVCRWLYSKYINLLFNISPGQYL